MTFQLTKVRAVRRDDIKLKIQENTHTQYTHTYIAYVIFYGYNENYQHYYYNYMIEASIEKKHIRRDEPIKR